MFEMLRVTVRLAFCLVLGLEFWLVNSRSSQSRIHRSSLTRHAREMRARRKSRSASPSSLPCFNQTKCRYTTAVLDFPPYIMNNSSERGFMYEKIEWLVETMCLEVVTTDDPVPCCLEPLFVRNSEEMVQLIKDMKVDFAFPIQTDAREELKDTKGVSVIRAFVSKGCSLIVNINQCQSESRVQLLTSITSQWPILVCMILLSGISGVVIWLLERTRNREQFSSTFTAGSPEGFWWALVTLITAGFDETPKTFLGRVFGIIWVLVGVIMLSFFTALFTNAMQAALDGSNCQDIDSKEVGVLVANNDAQLVAKEFNAAIIKFDNIKEMQKDLSSGAVGRVLVDRNSAFYFLDKYGLKRNRDIRLIREFDFPMDYYLVHVDRETGNLSPEGGMDDMDDLDDMEGNDKAPVDESGDSDLKEQRRKIASCGPVLKELSSHLVGASKATAQEQVIPAELQTASLADEVGGLFSTGSRMTSFFLFCLLGILLALIFLGMLWELYTKRSASVLKRRKGSFTHPEKNSLLNKTFIVDMEERLKDLITDLQTMKEFASAITKGGALEASLEKPSPDQPIHANQVHLIQTDPVQPVHTDAVSLVRCSSVQSNGSRSVPSSQSKPDQSTAQVSPVQPFQADQFHLVEISPVKPVQTSPSQSVETTPIQPVHSGQVQLVQTEKYSPASPGLPVQPVQNHSAQPDPF